MNNFLSASTVSNGSDEGMPDEREHIIRQYNLFPTDALPPVIRRFVLELAASLPVAAEMLILPCLISVAAAIDATRVLELRRGWRERAALYGVISHDAGGLKSPAMAAALAPVRLRHELYVAQYEEALKKFKDGASTTEPMRQRVFTTNVTTEMLAIILAQNRRGILQYLDELTALVRTFDQYRSRGADKEFYCSAWSGASIAVDRITRESVFVKEPCLNILGAVPCNMLYQLDESHFGSDGWVQRFLFSLPSRVPVRWSERSVSEEAEDRYGELIDGLFELEFNAGEPVVLSLDDRAKTAFALWHDEHCQFLDEPKISDFNRTILSKLKGYCARLALIHALCVDPTSRIVTHESITAASRMVSYFYAEALKVEPYFVKRRLSHEDKCQREIFRALSSGRQLSKRDLKHFGNSTTEVFNNVYAQLLAKGDISEIEVVGSRRPRTVVVLP